MCKGIEFDHSKLRGLIREKELTEKEVAERVGIAKASMSNKLNGISSFTTPEAFNICNVLGISTENITAYFFTQKVQKC